MAIEGIKGIDGRLDIGKGSAQVQLIGKARLALASKYSTIFLLDDAEAMSTRMTRRDPIHILWLRPISDILDLSIRRKRPLDIIVRNRTTTPQSKFERALVRVSATSPLDNDRHLPDSSRVYIPR